MDAVFVFSALAMMLGVFGLMVGLIEYLRGRK